MIAFTDITTEHLAQRLLDTTLEVAPAGLAILDADRSILRCNQTFADQAGRAPQQQVGIDVAELLHPEDRGFATEVGRRIRDGVTTGGELEQRVVRPDGTERWVNTHVAVIPDPTRPRLVAASFDVTERRQMVTQLSRFSDLFNSANDMITVIDPTGQILYASPSTERILGYPEHARLVGGILGLVHPDDLKRPNDKLSALIAGTRGREPFTARVLTLRDEVRHVECVGVNLLAEPAVGGVVITARDVTERVELTEQLAHSALHDTLTDLPNRRMVEATLEGALTRTRWDRTRIGLCFVDLDGFKACQRHSRSRGRRPSDRRRRRQHHAKHPHHRSGGTCRR